MNAKVGLLEGQDHSTARMYKIAVNLHDAMLFLAGSPVIEDTFYTFFEDVLGFLRVGVGVSIYI